MRTSNPWTSPKLAVFSFFHTIGTVGLILVLWLLLGCIKKPDTQVEKGPQVSLNVIASEIESSTAGKTLLDLQEGDYANYSISAEAFTSGAEHQGNRYSEVLKRTDIGDKIELQIYYRITDSKGNIEDERAETCKVSKLDPWNSDCLTPFLLSFLGVRGTLHNFSTGFSTQDPNTDLKSAPNCSGIPGCKFHVQKIEFDDVWDENIPDGRAKNIIEIAAEGNFVGSIVNYCQKKHVTVNGLYVPGTFCYKLNKLRYGSAPQATSADIESAISGALGGHHLAESRQGDAVLAAQFSKAGSAPVQYSLLQKDILSSATNGASTQLQIKSTAMTYPEGNPVGTPNTENCQAANDGSSHSCTSFPLPLKALQIEPGTTTKFYNLTVGTATVEPPKSVKERPGCGGVPGCQLTATVVRFERRVIKNGVQGSSFHLIELSPEAPAISRPTYSCETGSQPQNGNPLPYMDCQLVLDFVYGP